MSVIVSDVQCCHSYLEKVKVTHAHTLSHKQTDRQTDTHTHHSIALNGNR